jgi:hypothetical protein
VLHNSFCWSRSRTRRAWVYRRNERLVFCGDEGVDLLAQLAWQVEAIDQLFPRLHHLFADSVYNSPNLRETLAKFGNWDP